MIGKPMPDFTYGITLTANYKNFDFLIFGNGSVGNDVFMSYSYNSISYTLKEMYDDGTIAKLCEKWGEYGISIDNWVLVD